MVKNSSQKNPFELPNGFVLGGIVFYGTCCCEKWLLMYDRLLFY